MSEEEEVRTMSVTTERIRTPEIRTPEITTVAATRRRRGGWVIVAIALVLAVAAALVLLPRPTIEPATAPAGRVEAASEQASEIWALKAAHARALQAAGAAAVEQPSITTTTATTAGEWATKAAYGRSLQTGSQG
jgi:hypothetical protein